MDELFNIYFPPRICFGEGCLKFLTDELTARNLKKPLIVTDSGVIKAGILEKVLAVLNQVNLNREIFSGVIPNPDTEVVKNGLNLYVKAGCDSLVAVGGGSSIDTAKAIGILAGNGGEIMDYEGPGKVKYPLPFLAAIPTTYGSGSEVTSFVVITDEKRKFKAAMGSPYIIPKIAFIEPQMMVRLPKDIGASVGIDALCHAIESYVAKSAQPFSKALAIEAIRLIFQNIKPAVEKKDITAVFHMGIASTMAGMAFSQTRLGIVHAMAHPLGGHYNIPHGIANAVLLPWCMEFNLPAAPDRFAEIARAMGVTAPGSPPEKVAQKSIEILRELEKSLGIPSNMSQLGVKKESIPQMVEDTMVSGNIKVNPREVNIEDVIELYTKCM